MTSAGSPSETSDFSPSPSPSSMHSPRAESSTQAQQRASKRASSNIDVRSSPPQYRHLQNLSRFSSDRSQHASDMISHLAVPSIQTTQNQRDRFARVVTSSPSLSPIPNFPRLRLQKRKSSSPTFYPSSDSCSPSKLIKSSHLDRNQSKNKELPERTLQAVEPQDLYSYLSRPNRYLGPASTWRSWTEAERTVVASLDRVRSQNLSIHLYNAFALRRKAEKAGHSGSSRQNRSRSRSQSVRRSQSRSRSKGRVAAKGKAREDSTEAEVDAVQVSGDGADDREPLFVPPRIWTAWPLPPNEVPREDLVPAALLHGYKAKRDKRLSAELEDCLIAVASRFAKERWEAREVESASEDENGKSDRRKKQKGNVHQVASENTKVQDATDTHMEEDQHMDVGQSKGAAERLDTQSDTSSDEETGIPLFSSQMFTARSSPSDSADSSDDGEEAKEMEPVFSADDDHIRHLLLLPTRHVMSQLDGLLEALHKMQTNQRRKSVAIGSQGHEQILGMAGLFFSPDVMDRARQRCAKLFDDAAFTGLL